MRTSRPFGSGLLFILLAALGACTSGADGDDHPDACLALCESHLDISIAGLVAGQLYEISATTAAASEACTVDTHDGLEMTCSGATFHSDHLDDARISFAGSPGSVDMVASRDGVEIANDILAPTYEQRTVCATSCEVGEASFELE